MNESDLAFYGAYLPVLMNTEQAMLAEIKRILHAVSPDEEQFPAEHVCSRIKEASSMQEKLQKRGIQPTVRNGLLMLSDVIGLRVVTHFIGDVYAILQQIQESPCWELVRIKDYIASPKPNGYRSLHVIVKVPFADRELPEIQTEIQLRTIAMDCWASLEHQLKYKKNIKNAELIGTELQRCASEIASTDLTMQTIREMIRLEQTRR